MKITHQFLEQCLSLGHQRAKKVSAVKRAWPSSATPQSDWTLWAHYTLAEAILIVYPSVQLATMSLRVSDTKKAPGFWAGFQAGNMVRDYTTQQQGVDFCLMGPTGARVHHLTAESECKANDSVSISLSEQGYIWDWSKLLSDNSEHRLLFAVVGAGPKSANPISGATKNRRSTLMKNMEAFLKDTHPNIANPDGIGGFIIAQQLIERQETYTFILDNGKIDFKKVTDPAALR